MQESAKIREQEMGAAALGVLVKQFAGKFDFIRELVQNSLDSGTATVEVWTAYRRLESGGGVCEIHVDDNGVGMDEAIIDAKLTTLFSSSKEDDLTHIGKFGIGFASVFSLEPDGVLVRTARGGERWEVFFDKDRTFEKTRLEDPVEGTKITVFKEMGPFAYRTAVKNVVEMLSFWCRYAEKQILFHDTEAAPKRRSVAAGRRRRRGGIEKRVINEPFVVEGELPVRVERGETTIAMAFSKRPFFGFYNHGLTLKETDVDDILGWAAPYFRNVTFKIKSAYLEHTLTRDTILMDENYEKALLLLVNAAREDLVENLLVTLETLAAQPTLKGKERQAYLCALKWLYALQWELDPTFRRREQLKDISFNASENVRRAVAKVFEPNRQKKGRQRSIDASKRRIFRQCHGEAVTLDQLRRHLHVASDRLILSSNENDMTQELHNHKKPVFLSPVTADAKRFFISHVTQEAKSYVDGPGSMLPTVFGVGDRVWLFEGLNKKTLSDKEQDLLETIATLAATVNQRVFPVNFLGDNPRRYILGGRQIAFRIASTLPMNGKPLPRRLIAIDVRGRLFKKLSGAAPRDVAVLIAAKCLAELLELDPAERVRMTHRAEELIS